MKSVFLLPIFAWTGLFGQSESGQDWNAFQQIFDVTAYQGGHFRLKAFAKVENGSNLTNARLWARVDTKEKTAFYY